MVSPIVTEATIVLPMEERLNALQFELGTVLKNRDAANIMGKLSEACDQLIEKLDSDSLAHLQALCDAFATDQAVDTDLQSKLKTALGLVLEDAINQYPANDGLAVSLSGLLSTMLPLLSKQDSSARESLHHLVDLHGAGRRLDQALTKVSETTRETIQESRRHVELDAINLMSACGRFKTKLGQHDGIIAGLSDMPSQLRDVVQTRMLDAGRDFLIKADATRTTVTTMLHDDLIDSMRERSEALDKNKGGLGGGKDYREGLAAKPSWKALREKVLATLAKSEVAANLDVDVLKAQEAILLIVWRVSVSTKLPERLNVGVLSARVLVRAAWPY